MYYNRDEITLLYNHSREKDRKTLAIAMAVNSKINKQELNSVKVSETLFFIFLEKLAKEPKNIANKALPYYQNELRGKNLSKRDWYSLITNNPELLKAPLALYKDKAIICNTPTDILKLAS